MSEDAKQFGDARIFQQTWLEPTEWMTSAGLTERR
jgi:hypothetical protein